jgi:phenylacetaldehyde dehydrogenase
MTDPRIIAGLNLLGEGRGRLFINGAWVRGDDEMASISPSTGELTAEIALAGQAQVDAAMDSASAAMASWGAMSAATRASALLRLADLIDTHNEAIAALEAADGVRPFIEALYGDVPAGANILRYFAGLAGQIDGAVKYPSIGYAPPGSRIRALVEKAPIGPVATIIPWNFPFVMACARIAPALAAGCPVVLKPAEDASLSCLLLGRLAQMAELPAGAFNVLTGRGAETGAALVCHPASAKISFIGSSAVGREIGAIAGGLLKRHTLELGGKCPAIVMDDADLDAAAAGLAGAAFGNAGQICVAAARILVHEKVAEAFHQKLAEQAQVRQPGSTFDPGAGVGPIISVRQQARLTGLIEDAQAHGAHIAGGASNTLPASGFYQNPLIVSGLPVEARMANEEIFGPVTVIETVASLDDAIARANATEYGLAASIWTQRWRDADEALRRIKAGMIYTNCHAWADPVLPMGGLKASGIGVEGGREGLENYLMSKTMLALL